MAIHGKKGEEKQNVYELETMLPAASGDAPLANGSHGNTLAQNGLHKSYEAVQGEQSTQDGRRMVFVQTVAAIASWIAMGLFSEVSGPTLTFLMARVRADYEQISRALTARSVGYLMGALLVGALAQRWPGRSNLWLCLACLLGGAVTAAQPHVLSLPLLATLFWTDGIAKGVIAAGANTLIFSLWGTRSAVPTQLLHGAFGVGAIVSTQVSRPFLPTDCQADPESFSSTGTGSLDVENSTSLASYSMTINGHNSSRPAVCDYLGAPIEIPYFIVAAVTALLGAVFGVLHAVASRRGGAQRRLTEPQQDKTSFCNIFRENKVSFVLLVVAFFVLWALPVGAERAYGKFLFAFATDTPLRFSPSQATQLMLVFWTTFTAGRALASLLALCLSPCALLALELSVGAASAVVMADTAHQHGLALWVGTALFAASLSPVCPGALSWANLLLPMTPVMTSFAFIGTATGAILFSYISGSLFQFSGPRSLMYLMVAYAATGLLLVVVIAVTNRLRPLNRLKVTSETASTEEADKL